MAGLSGGTGPALKQKFGLVLQGGGALGAYEVGAVEYLYERGMECAIVTGASAGAVNAAALAGATQYPPRVLRKLWEKLASRFADPVPARHPVPSLPQWMTRLWFSDTPLLVVPGMYRPRLDVWNLPIGPTSRSPRWARRWKISWTGIRYAIHGTCGDRLGQRRRGRRGRLLHQHPRGQAPAPAAAEVPAGTVRALSTCWPAAASRAASRGPRSETGPTGTAASPTTPRSSRSSTT